jgi:hypothetical protein
VTPAPQVKIPLLQWHSTSRHIISARCLPERFQA